VHPRSSKRVAHHSLGLLLGRVSKSDERFLIRLRPVVIGEVLIKSTNATERIVLVCRRLTLEFSEPIAYSAAGLFKLLAKDLRNVLLFLLPVSHL